MEAENLSGPQCKTQLFLAKAKFILNFFMEEFFPFSLAFLHLSLIDQAVLHFWSLAANHEKGLPCPGVLASGGTAVAQEARGAGGAPLLRLAEPVSLDGNVALLQLRLLKKGLLLFLYLSLPNWWLHPPPRQENRTKSFHRTLQLLCLFLFFLFPFFPPQFFVPQQGAEV